MQLTTFFTLAFITSTAVLALPQNYGASPAHRNDGATPAHHNDKPEQSITHHPWRRTTHLEVREAEPEPMPAALPEPVAHPVADVDFTPTVVQRSPPSEPNPHSNVPPGHGPGSIPEPPMHSVHHQAWVRALPDLALVKRDATELVDVQEHQIEARDASPEVLEARDPPTPASGKWPPGYHGFPVGELIRFPQFLSRHQGY